MKHNVEDAKPIAARIAGPNVEEKSGEKPSQHPALQLQQQAGNQAVQELVRARAIQAKLEVSQPGDPEEQEADQVAENIMRSHAAAGTACSCAEGEEMCDECSQKSGSMISRKADVSGSPTAGHAAISRVLHSSGHPMDASARSFFEPRFGRDFSNVRVHTGPEAAESARSIDALAYTAGEHIVFGAGQYMPHSTAGVRLLSHELAHVVQQQQSSPDHIARAPAARPSIKTGMFKGWNYVAYMDQGIIRFARDVLNEDPNGNKRIGAVPWLANNPGNLTVDTGPTAGPAAKEPFKHGAFTKTAADQDLKTRRYAIFSSAEEGRGAIYWVLKVINESNGGKLTLRGVLKVYKGRESSEKESVKTTYVGRIRQFMADNLVAEASRSQPEAEREADSILDRPFSSFYPEDFDFYVADALTREEGILSLPGVEYSCTNRFATNDRTLYTNEQWAAMDTLKSFESDIRAILDCP